MAGKPKSHFGKRIKIWEQNTDLKNAYKKSTVWFHVAASLKIKRGKYEKELKKIRYGNRLPFSQTSIDKVKRIMVSESNVCPSTSVPYTSGTMG
jgi:beta-lactamase class D